MNTIGVVGQGFVGSAVREGMRHAFEVVTYDKKDPDLIYVWRNDEAEVRVEGYRIPPDKNGLEYLLERTDGPIFVCLPTPMKKNGEADTSIVMTVVTQLDSLSDTQRVVVVKSTVPPGTVAQLNDNASMNVVCFNPEFLTERDAVNDFKNQDRIIIGGPREGTSVLKQMYSTAYPEVPVTKTSSTIAEMVKYVTNCFLAVKVSFANEMKQICDKLYDVDYDKIIEYATKDKRLGVSHWMVPGPSPSSDGSGKLLPGFSGSCFVKDINALMFMAKQIGVDPKVMSGAWEKNLEVRPEKDWEKLVGRAVTKIEKQEPLNPCQK